MRRKSIVVGLLITLFTCQSVAATVVFPDPEPKVTWKASPPPWLPVGKGDDGYVSVRVEVRTPGAICRQLGTPGVPLLRLFKQSIQVVASLKTSGLMSSLDGQEVPIATFDGRTDPKACIGLNTLPLTVASFARLESFGDGKSTQAKILVSVKSTTDAGVDIISAAQTILGVATVFATGGATATISGITTALAKPAITSIQQQINIDLSKVIEGQAPRDITWEEMRRGIDTITVPVYRVDTGWFDTPEEAIERLRKLGDMSSVERLFDIVLTFSYSKTLFDPSIIGVTALPVDDAIAKERVLNFPRQQGVNNFLQLLNSSSPSLLQSATAVSTPGDFGEVCGKVIDALREAGLNLMDRTIITKAFIDEAKKAIEWYTPENVTGCFSSYPAAKNMLIEIYGNPNTPRFFQIRDVQQNGEGARYEAWRKAVPPAFAEFRRALLSADDRKGALSRLGGGADITVNVYPTSSAWAPTEQEGSSDGAFPGISLLAARQIIGAGCFVYGVDSSLDPDRYGGYMLLKDASGSFWNASLKLSQDEVRRVKTLDLQPLNDEWRNHYIGSTYNGGDCSTLLKQIPSTAKD